MNASMDVAAGVRKYATEHLSILALLWTPAFCTGLRLIFRRHISAGHRQLVLENFIAAESPLEDLIDGVILLALLGRGYLAGIIVVSDAGALCEIDFAEFVWDGLA